MTTAAQCPDLDSAPELAAAIPPLILEGLQRYATERLPTGGFLYYVLTNNLTEAVCRADDESLAAIREIVKYVYNCLPGRCHGSPAELARWVSGREQEESPAA